MDFLNARKSGYEVDEIHSEMYPMTRLDIRGAKPSASSASRVVTYIVKNKCKICLGCFLKV
jgi:hypothetical protein